MIYPYIMDSLNTNPDRYVPLFLAMELTDADKKLAIGQEIWDFYLKNETLSYRNLNRLEEVGSLSRPFDTVVEIMTLFTCDLIRGYNTTTRIKGTRSPGSQLIPMFVEFPSLGETRRGCRKQKC